MVSDAVGPRILPGPGPTFEFVAREWNRGTLTLHLWATTNRVLIGFAAAMVAGVFLGVLTGVNRRADQFLSAWVIAGLSVPRLVLFVVAYLVLGLNDRAAIIALTLTILPTVVVQVREGTLALDRKLIEMASAYRRSRLRILRQVVLPQLMPYIIGTGRTTLSLAWKMVILAELTGRTTGVGYQISFYFQMFNMTGILAYGFTMMVLLAVVDIVIMGGLQRWAFRWRRPALGAG